jgi:hypothetical protein
VTALNFGYHDDDPQYRFGLLPEPLMALPASSGRKPARLLPIGGDAL